MYKMHKHEYTGCGKGMCIYSDVWTFCQKSAPPPFVLIIQVLLLHPHAMYPVLMYLNVDFFNRFLHTFPIALILMRKTASFSIELLTVTVLGKVPLVASGSSCAGPVGHSSTAG